MAPPEEDCPTQVLFDRWKHGDDVAFAALHARLSPLLRARIQRHPGWQLLRSLCEGDDVLQQIWARAAPTLKTHFEPRGTGSLLAFLGKISDDEVVDLVRRHTAKKRGQGGPKVLDTGFDAPDIAGPRRAAPETPTSHARRSELEDLAQAVLNERELTAWQLVEMGGYTAEEAALALLCTGSAVRSLLLRARAKLIERVGGNETKASNDSG